jgi:predicted ATPase
VLLLVNCRPEYQHGWGRKTYYTQLRLDALGPESAVELLRVLVGEDPGLEALKQFFIAQTGGTPFFLEESVRTLVETGALAGERGAYRLTRPRMKIHVPATVQAILAARIDRLACSCVVVFERWVTSMDADADLISWARPKRAETRRRAAHTARHSL